MDLYSLVNKTDFCPNCCKNQKYKIYEEKRIRYYLGDKIEYTPLIARCEKCNSEIWIPFLCHENLRRYEEEYKKKQQNNK